MPTPEPDHPVPPDPGATSPAGADHRARQSRGTRRRQQILDEAIDLFAEKGFRGASLDELARRCDMTHPGLLYYFGTKDRLLLEAVAERDRVDAEGLRARGVTELPSLRHLPDVGRWNAEHATLVRLHAVLAPENLSPGAPLHGFFTDRYRWARGVMARAIEHDIRDGALRDDLDIDQLATEVIATMIGFDLQWLMDPSLDYVGLLEGYTAALFDRYAPDGSR